MGLGGLARDGGVLMGPNTNAVLLRHYGREFEARRTQVCKQSIPEYEVQALPDIVRPEGRLVFTVMRHWTETHIVRFEYRVVLRGPNGSELGRCQFSYYRRKRGQYLSKDQIIGQMDAFAEEPYLYAVLLSETDFDFESCFNDFGILAADLLHVAPAMRGGSLWKHLYFSLMALVQVHQRKKLPYFVFKAFPLTHSKYYRPTTEQAMLRDARALRLFYQVQLGALMLDPDECSEFMVAPVPHRPG